VISNDLEEDQNPQKEVHDQNLKISPKSCVILESVFTRDDQTNIPGPFEEPSIRKVQETQKINIDTLDSPKYINLGTSCTSKETDQYTQLFEEFKEIIAWSYDDLKYYDN
jgi:hypothetical protein